MIKAPNAILKLLAGVPISTENNAWRILFRGDNEAKVVARIRFIAFNPL